MSTSTTLLSIILTKTIIINSQLCLEPSPNNPNVCCAPIGLPDDNPPDECLLSPINIFDKNGICNENFDCCKCEQIIINDALTHNCNGDSSCEGVPIKMNGNEAGAVLNCNGDRSCRYSIIDGTNLNAIRCDGDLSCELAIFNIKCASNKFDTGCIITANGDISLRQSIINIEYVTKLQCNGDISCANTKIDMLCVNTGCNINCGGDNSCINSNWIVRNVNLIEFVGDNAFLNSNVTADCVLPDGCPIRCSAESPCRDSFFDVTFSHGLLCSGIADSCTGAIFLLKSNVGGLFSCLGNDACSNSIMDGGYDDLGDIKPIINVGDIICSGNNACYNSDIFMNCNNEKGCLITCTGNNACSSNHEKEIVIYNAKALTCNGNTLITQPSCNGYINLEPFDNTFFLLCASPAACKHGEITLTFEEKLREISSITCGGLEGCESTKIDILRRGQLPFKLPTMLCNGESSCHQLKFNYEDDSDESIFTIDLLNCAAKNSCSFAKFKLISKIIRLNIDCGGEDSCKNLIIEIESRNANIRVNCKIVNLRNTCANGMVNVNGEILDLIEFAQ